MSSVTHAAMASQSWATMRSRKRSTTPTAMPGTLAAGDIRPGGVGMVCGGARAAAARVRRGAASALIVTPFLLAGVAALFAVPSARAEPLPQAAAPDVQQIFLADCAICHGADAHGTNRGPT